MGEVTTTKKFRLHCKCFYGTWPQCAITKEDCLANAIRILPPISWAVVASEAHKDGTPHLHGIFYFVEKADLKDANATLDLICMKHGNYQGAKSPTKVLRYVCKDDNYTTFGDVPDFKEKPKVMDAIAKLIHEGKTLKEIDLLHPGVTIMHKRKLEEYESWVKIQKVNDDRLPWSEVSTPPPDHPDYMQLLLLVDWLNRNILKKRKPRQQQLYISGPHGIGKSRLIGHLQRFLSVYVMPNNEDYYDFWENDTYSIAVLDEFNNSKAIQHLNQWLDGQLMCLKQKGKQIIKSHNLPIIILSNLLLEENYMKTKDVVRDALSSRLVQITLTVEFNLFPDLE